MLLSATFASPPGHAEPGDIVVTTLAASGTGSLRDALGQASSSAHDDRIVFDPSLSGSIYVSTGTLAVAAGGQSGDLTIDGPGADVIQIDSFGNERLLDITGPGGDLRPRVTVSGLTLQSGQTFNPGSTSDGDGGAIRAVGVDLVLDRVVVTNSLAAGDGGGVHVEGGNLDVFESRFTNNAAHRTDNFTGGYGGAISVRGADASSSTLRVVDSVLDGNSAGAGGGGIHAAPGTVVTVTNSRVRDNVVSQWVTFSAGCGIAGDGGGIHADELLVTDSLVTGNRAGSEGGGLFAGTVELRRSTVARNTAQGGGGLALRGTRLGDSSLVDTSTVADNVAGRAGAVFSIHPLTIRTSTIAGNAANTGGGVQIHAPLTLQGTVVAMNSGGDLAGSGEASAENSLVKDPRDMSVEVVGPAVTAADPLLSRLAVHGTGLQTLLPAPNSPLIDGGSGFGVTSDQRGQTRPVDDPDVADAADGSDIGAVELTAAEQAGPPQVANLQVPRISGRARVGRTLTADGGAWAPATDLISYQWLRDGVPIPGADEASYTLTSDDYGWNGRCADSRHRLSVWVTATAEGHRSGTAVSEVTPRVELGRLQITREARVTGRLRVGSTLRAEPRLGSISPRPDDVRIRWFLDDRRVRPLDRGQLQLRPRMRGKRVSVEFWYDAPYGYADVTQRVERRRRVR